MKTGEVDKGIGSLGILMLAVLVSAVIAVAVSTALLFTSEPPYSSEETPLTATVDGVLWTNEIADMPVEWSYNHLKVSLHCGANSSLWLDFEAEALSSGALATVDIGPPDSGNLSLVSLNLTDVEGNGVFDQGDSLMFVLLPGLSFAEDTVYELRITYDDAVLCAPFHTSFAFHKGSFYTWDSSPKDLRIM